MVPESVHAATFEGADTVMQSSANPELIRSEKGGRRSESDSGSLQVAILLFDWNQVSD